VVDGATKLTVLYLCQFLAVGVALIQSIVSTARGLVCCTNLSWCIRRCVRSSIENDIRARIGLLRLHLTTTDHGTANNKSDHKLASGHTHPTLL